MLSLVRRDEVDVVNLLPSLLPYLARCRSLGTKDLRLRMRVFPNDPLVSKANAVHDKLFGFEMSLKLLDCDPVLRVQ